MSTTKKKVRKNAIRSRILTSALSLGLLAAAAMIGMYTIGKNEQQKQEEELAEKVAEAEKAFEEAQRKQEELERQAEEERQQAASSDTKAQFEEENELVAELESDFASVQDYTLSAQEQADLDAAADAAALMDAQAQEAAAITYSFTPESDKLLWPIAGNIILDYSMDKTVYFATLEQYKYNPAVLIQGDVGREVLCAADGKVSKIQTTDELGITVTVDIGSGYEAVYGQLKGIAVEQGSHVQAGTKLGLVSEPTRYYAKEGTNVYFQILKDGEPVDPMDLLQ